VDFDLNKLLDDLGSALALQAHAKGLELYSIAGPEVPVQLRGDPGRLRQILTNLAGNAIKFTEKGEVAVRVSLAEAGEYDCVLRFSVRDTGIGIAEDKIATLFDKFSQVDTSTTRKYGGTGLGLAISKQLAEMMGGGVSVTSHPGRGSEFLVTVRLGLGDQSERAEAASSAPAALSLRGVRVLIVDDNATGRESLTTLTDSLGMRAVEVESGVLALQALNRAVAKNDPFRIAVIDMQMPGMDGEALGRAIKSDPRLANTRMVMLTSLGTHAAIHHEETGFSSQATRPVRRETLHGLLSKALSGTNISGRVLAITPEASKPPSVRDRLLHFDGIDARILLAEDNITNQQVALGILKKLGLSADIANNGAEAVKALESIPYDLVLMDLQMPIMGGIEATREIRNTQSSVLDHNIPIIAMTANAMQSDRNLCIEEGMNDFLPKPISTAGFREALDRWLRKEKRRTAGAAGPSLSSETGEGEAIVFDQSGVLERTMDDSDLATLVFDTFLTDMPLQIEALQVLLEGGDAPASMRHAHSIKGAAANVGGERLRKLAAEMEKAARGGELNSVIDRMAELSARFLELQEAIKQDWRPEQVLVLD
jgi:CheY-like chemotaxis protein